MIKFQIFRAFYSSSVEFLLKIPSATQCSLCASQSYLTLFKSINVENHRKIVNTPSLFDKKMNLIARCSI